MRIGHWSAPYSLRRNHGQSVPGTLGWTAGLYRLFLSSHRPGQPLRWRIQNWKMEFYRASCDMGCLPWESRYLWWKHQNMLLGGACKRWSLTMFEPETLIVGKLPGAGPVVIQVSDTYGYLRRYTPEEILSLPFADLNFSIESVDFMLF